MPELPSVPDDPGGYIKRVVMLVRDAALALQTVHDQDVIHRDVKPANLMLTPDGTRVVLMDFGLAKGKSLELTSSNAGGLLGTLRYAAPEQLAAATLKIGPSADVRGLGVTLWELVTRRRLFGDASDEKQLAGQIFETDVPRLRSIDRSFDPDLEAIVARATERRSSDRIASAGALAEYLQLYFEGKPLPIRPPTTSEMVGRWIRAHKPLVGSVAAVIAAIMIAVSTAFVLITKAKNGEARARQVAEERLELVEHGTYNLQLGRVHDLLGRDRVAASRLLDDVQAFPLAFREFTWGYFRTLAPPIRKPIEPERYSVLSVAFSPDGTALATAGADHTVKIWNLENGHLLTTHRGHQESVSSVAFSPDGKTLASADHRDVRLWGARQGVLNDDAGSNECLSFAPTADHWPRRASTE